MSVPGDGCAERGARRPRLVGIASVVAAAIAFWAAAPGIARADSCNWTGAGANNLWSTAANWSCDGAHVVPESGDTLYFESGKPQRQNVNDLVGLDQIRIQVFEDYQITGNRIFVRDLLGYGTGTLFLLPVTLTYGLGATEVYVGSEMGSDLTMGDIDLNGKRLFANTNGLVDYGGVITGDGLLRIPTSGTLVLGGQNDYTGVTEINNGSVVANSNTALGATGSGNHTRVADGAGLRIGPGVSVAEPLILNGSGPSGFGALYLASGTSTLTGTIEAETSSQIVVGSGGDLRIAGPLTSDPGSLFFKYGPGTLTLSSPANAYFGLNVPEGVLRLGATGVLPDAPTLQMGGTLDLNGHDETIGSLLGPTTGVLALDGGTLTVTQTADLDFEGAITGTGGFVKAGNARLTLAGSSSNTFTGTTTVTAGQLRFAKGSSAQAISGPLVINGGEVLVDVLNQITDTVPITVNAPGVLKMTGSGGTIENVGSLSGTGTVTLTGHTLSVGFDNQSTVFYGVINGTSAFLGKFGTGTLTLMGNNVVSGTTSVYGGGGLIVHGSLPSRVFVAAGLVGGSGTIGEIDASTGFGSIAPGPAPGGAGVLSTSKVSFGSAMTYVVELYGPTAGTGYDQLAVSTQVSIGNAALAVTRAFTPASNAAFTIVDNASNAPVIGTFAGLPQNAMLFVDGQAFRISYTGGDGNDIVLTALEPPAFSISDATVNEGTSGSVNAVFTVSTSTAPFQTVSIQFATENVSAESPQDYTAHSGTLTFLPGTTSQTVTIAVHGDKEPELTETFIVHLSGAQGGATIEDADGIGTIESDDAPDPPLTYYLAEGATGAFFDSDVLIANPYDDPAPVTLTFYTQQGEPVFEERTLAPRSRTTIHVDQIEGLEDASVSVRVRSDSGQPLTVERTMFWDSSYYGGHTGTAVDQPATRWFFAEAAQGFFDTYVLVTNANSDPADVTVTFLREGETPVVKTISVEASSRATIGAGDYPELEGRSFGLIVDATQPVIAERAMYFGSTPTRLWTGGHESPGVSQASTSWFIAEGATGAFFDTFILLGNPGDDAAHVNLDFLLESGEKVSVQRDVPAKGRVTVALESIDDPRMQNGAVSTVVTSDRPIVAERSTYWAGDAQPWGEGHNSFGLTETAVSWGLAEGRVGGTHQFATYILLANPSATETADVLVTYLRESGTPVSLTYHVPPNSRFTIDAATVPELANQSFGAKIFVTNGVAIAVERSMYWNANGVFWAGGSHAPAQRLP